VFNTIFSRAKGLMGVKPDRGLYALFPLPYGMYAPITMFGMRYALDIAWLAEDGKIVELVLGARPWSISHGGTKKARYIIETHQGNFAKLRVGMRFKPALLSQPQTRK
jgi:uncharacterized membrane protein (UPF0127 family)